VYPRSVYITVWYGDSRESTIHHVKIRLQGFVHPTTSCISNRLPKWKDLWNLRAGSRKRQKCRIRSTNLRSTYSSDAGTSASLQVTSELQAHREVILRSSRNVRSGNKRHDSLTSKPHRRDIQRVRDPANVSCRSSALGRSQTILTPDQQSSAYNARS
jgi:hypothetical protein